MTENTLSIVILAAAILGTGLILARIVFVIRDIRKKKRSCHRLDSLAAALMGAFFMVLAATPTPNVQVAGVKLFLSLTAIYYIPGLLFPKKKA